MKKENKELIIISGFMGSAIGVLCMMFINVDKESRLKEQIEEQNNTLCFYYEECEECLLYTPCHECCENCDEIDWNTD